MKKTHGLTAAILAAALFATGCAPTETKRGTAEVVDDATITSKVKAALSRPLTPR